MNTLTIVHDGREYFCKYQPIKNGEECEVTVSEMVDTRTLINRRRIGHFTFRVADFPTIHKGIVHNLEFFIKSWHK